MPPERKPKLLPGALANVPYGKEIGIAIMEMNDHEAELRQKLFTLTLIWASMTVSVGAYAVALYLLDMNGALPFAPMDDANGSTVQMALLLMAATAGASTFTLPGILLKPEALQEQLRKKGIEPKSLPTDELGMALFQQYQVVGILRWGAGEGVGMMGLVMGLITGLGPMVYGLLIVSAFLLVTMKPSREALDHLATAVRGM